MKLTFALVLATVGLSACTDTLDPRSEKHPSASLEVAQAHAAAGSPAAILGDLSLADLSATAPATTLAGAVAAAAGGSVVLPNAYTNVMGESANSFPHSHANMRYQQVFLESELQGVRAVSGLCLRRDEIEPAFAQIQQLTVKLGPTHLDYTNLTLVFDANYAAPPTTVFSGDANLPASLGGGTPGDFFFCVDFTTTYIHPAGFNVIVEIVNTSPTPSLLDFYDACLGNPGCTTKRIWAFSATAPVGLNDDPFLYGLIMKFNSSDPSTKDDCRDGGWERFGFKNQGQCIRFIETGQDSR
jgi:hypothetical protein